MVLNNAELAGEQVLPAAGRLRHGVPFPAVGPGHLTWDTVVDRAPNRPWRRWATDRTVNRTLRVLAAHRAARPDAPPVLVGDELVHHDDHLRVRFGP